MRRQVVRVSSKGQIVLPKRYREKMDLRDGDYVAVYEINNGILLIEKLAQSPLDRITAGLRAEVRRQRFTPEELESLIQSVRAEQQSDAA